LLILCNGSLVLVLLAAVAGFRYALAVIEVRREAHRAEVHPLNDLGATRSLEILPLYENATLNRGYQTGHGVSYLIRTDQTTLLMDLGQNETNTSPSALEYNMQMLDLTWKDIDLIFISHNHPDHTGGLHYGNRTAQDLADELAFLHQHNIRLLALSPHDSLPATVQVFQQAFPQAYQPIQVGRAIHFDNTVSGQ
jgi:metal-dependent hydrolase (beta-lactamase superfamily II)